jgi:hypothetical protein
MRSYLHIKGKKLWKLCAILVIVIVISCCGTEITELTQPTTATVNHTITIALQTTYCTTTTGVGKLVVAVLMPVGWKGASNMTMTYSNTSVGNGVLTPVSSTLAEPQSKVPWATACLNKFGIANNYINDMEWVVFISDKAYNYSTVSAAPVNIGIQLNVGADDNNANVNLNYVVCEDQDGLRDPDAPGAYLYAYNNCSYPDPYEYYELKSGPTLAVTGGIAGSLLDYAHPQLSTVIPAKALMDDFVTVTFFGDIDTTKLLNAPQVYLSATAYATDSTAYPFTGAQTKALMTQTSSTSNIYQLSLWPRAYFNVPQTKTLDRIEYLITDQTGKIVVGKDSSLTKFIYQFTCENK